MGHEKRPAGGGIKPAAGKTVWTGPEMAKHDDWIVHFPSALMDEFDSALAASKREGLMVEQLSPENFDIPSLRKFTAPLLTELSHAGRGFVLLRGLDIDRYSEEECSFLLWAIGNDLGLPCPQGQTSGRIGHVRDVDIDDPEHYYFHIGGPLVMHMDPVDVVGLLCLMPAKSGGASVIVSSLAVHNRILETRPDLLQVLYEGYYNHKRTVDQAGQLPVTDYKCPLFADLDGELISSYIRSPIERAVCLGGVTMSPLEEEALNYLDEVASDAELTMDMPFQPGDIQFLNNRVTLHGRRDYEDYPEMERRRHLLRVWLTIPEWKKYPPNIPHFDIETGSLAA